MTRRIRLTQGKFARVNSEDFDALNKLKWFARFDGFNWYAARNVRYPDGRRRTESMHSHIMGICVGKEIDHINGDGLDNRTDNLRFVTHSHNLMNRGRQSNNSSGFVGVSFHKASGRYRAYGRRGGKHIHLGVHDTLSAARAAYAKFAEAHYKIT